MRLNRNVASQRHFQTSLAGVLSSARSYSLGVRGQENYCQGTFSARQRHGVPLVSGFRTRGCTVSPLLPSRCQGKAKTRREGRQNSGESASTAGFPSLSGCKLLDEREEVEREQLPACNLRRLDWRGTPILCFFTKAPSSVCHPHPAKLQAEAELTQGQPAQMGWTRKRTGKP